MNTTENLPSNDGKPLIKPKAKSTERHEREVLSQFAEKLQLSTATVRRVLYVDEYGSEEIKASLDSGKIIDLTYETFSKKEKVS